MFFIQAHLYPFSLDHTFLFQMYSLLYYLCLLESEELCILYFYISVALKFKREGSNGL